MLLMLLAGCPSVFGDNANHTGLADTATIVCTGNLSSAPASGVVVSTWTVEGVSRLVTVDGLCVNAEGTRAVIAIDDSGSGVWITVQSATTGSFNLPGDDASVTVEGSNSWYADDFYAGTVTMDVGFGNLTGDATASGGQSLSLDLSWTGTASTL